MSCLPAPCRGNNELAVVCYEYDLILLVTVIATLCSNVELLLVIFVIVSAKTLHVSMQFLAYFSEFEIS